MNKNPSIVLIVSIVLIAAILIGMIGYYIGGNKGKETGYELGWQALGTRLKDIGFIHPLMEKREIKTLYGEVEKIEGKKITIKIRPLHPLADPSLDTRIVEIDDTTEIFRMESIKTDLSEQGFVLKQTQADMSDLNLEQNLLINTEEDIMNSKEFKAIKIVISGGKYSVPEQGQEIEQENGDQPQNFQM